MTVDRHSAREAAGQLRLGDIRDQRSYYIPPSEALPMVEWRPPRASELPSWRDAKRVSVDVECRDEQLRMLGPGCRRDPHENYVVGIAFAIEDGPEYYLPIKHHGGDNCDFDVWGYVVDQMRDFQGMLVGNGIGYDLDWIETELDRAGHLSKTTSVLTKSVMDVQILDVLLNELHLQYNLDALCNRRGLPGKDETILRDAASVYRVDPKIGMWRLPARFVGRYGEVDARRPLQVLRRQETEIDVEGIGQIWDLEKKVTPILVKMRRRGVRIDLEHLEAIRCLALQRETEHLDHVRSHTGVRIAVGDVWKTSVLAHALRATGVVVPMTERRISEKTGKMVGGQDSVDAKFLEKCGKVGHEILRARKWNKLRTTFHASVEKTLIGDRAHVTFNQLKSTEDDGEERGVRYGRLSSTDFNIQQMPIRDDEFGEMWRQIFVADVDAIGFASSDWSQQEPRIGVHYAELLGLPGAKEFADEYRRNPALDIHSKLTEIANDPVNLPRKVVKNFVNGRLYGMGDLKLCRQMSWPTEFKIIRGERREVPAPESQAKIDKFNSFAPWIAGLTRVAAREAEKKGYVFTWLRRKCRFERGPDGKIWKAHKAFNRIGQGTAADQMKATLVACDEEGIPIQMAVHDEFDWSFTSLAEAERVRELQMSVVKFRVPMKVDLEVGPSWGHLMKIEQWRRDHA